MPAFHIESTIFTLSFSVPVCVTPEWVMDNGRTLIRLSIPAHDKYTIDDWGSAETIHNSKIICNYHGSHSEGCFYVQVMQREMMQSQL